MHLSKNVFKKRRRIEQNVSFEKSLENRIRELYTDVIFSEHNLDKLFKASLVSISDDKLNSTQREKYFKKTFEEGILN